MRDKSSIITGKNAIIEAYKAKKTIDRLFIQKGIKDYSIQTILRYAKKNDTVIDFVEKNRLDEIDSDMKHQGVIAYVSSYEYKSIDDIMLLSKERGEDPFIIILDEVVDPHNIGAIIRSANCSGAHGVVIQKRHSPGITPTVVKSSAGAINYTYVAKVTNIRNTIKELKDKGLWVVCSDMDGKTMYDMDLTGPIALVIGNEGSGVSSLVKKECDMVASIPIKGEIESLNASVASGVLSYEIFRQRMKKNGLIK